ncbi:MAG: hypothetical protein ACP5NS_04185 [Candidatus Pacearchaeota archaeon]
MRGIECPRPAYERILESGVEPMIFARKKELVDIFLYGDIEENTVGKRILNWAENLVFGETRGISDETESAKDMLQLRRELNELEESSASDRFKYLFIEYPAFLARLVLGNNAINYEKYGFPTRKSLEESIASFCIGEEERIRNWDQRSHFWRRGNYKFEINQNMHGDLWAGQTDISGREIRDQTLFGEVTVFDTIKRDSVTTSVQAYQDWGPFLAITLKYAQAIGKGNIREIRDWEAVLEETGFVRTNTAEAEFGGGGIDPTDFLMDRPVMEEGKRSEILPLTMGHSNESLWIPYIQNGRLIYLAKNKEGEVKLKTPFSKDAETYSPALVYDSEDLPEVLKATYKLFARDRTDLKRIMKRFLATS